MYLRAAKTDADAAGESTEGMAESVSELEDELSSLTGGKVHVLDGDSFRSTYDILKDLSDVWDDLSELTQANITEMIGGKRNSNVITALMENFDIAEKALTTSANSSGSALAENEKQLDSIQGKLSVLSASFQTLSTDVINSSLVKGIVDAGTTALDIIDSLVNGIGSLSTVLTGAGIVKVIKDVA